MSQLEVSRVRSRFKDIQRVYQHLLAIVSACLGQLACQELKQRANSLYKDGDLDGSIQLYSAAINLDANCEDTRMVATLYYNRSAALRRKGDFEKALEDSNMALAARLYLTHGL